MAGEYTDRIRLRKAIERVREAEDRRARLQAAKDKYYREAVALRKAYEIAERALVKAKQEHPEPTGAEVFLGEADATVAGPVEKARATLRDAQAGLDRLDAEVPAMRAAEQAERDDLARANDARDQAIAGVLREYAGELVEAFHEARRRVVTIDFALSAIAQAVAGALPVGWDSQRDYQPDAALADAWKDAITALQTDAATPVPVVTTRNITKVTRTLVGGRAQMAPPGSRLH